MKVAIRWSVRIGCLLEWASLPALESGSLLVMVRRLLARVTEGFSQLWR